MGAVRGTKTGSYALLSGLLISNRVDSAAYPCANERRLQRVGEERTTSQCVVRSAFFRTQLLRAIDVPQIFAALPLHPAMHPNAEVANTTTSNPALIVLLLAFLKVLATRILVVALQFRPKMRI
jgi:hypothetical protein